MRILVVDDDRFTGEYLTGQLCEHGYDAVFMVSAVKALQRAATERFDLLVTDLVMPELNGIQAIRMFRKRLTALPIIVLSSLDPAQWEEKCKAVGAARYLQKPTSIEELVSEVALVEASLLHLRIGLIDFDPDHRSRLIRELEDVGCRVEAWSSLPELVQTYPTSAGDLTLLVLDTQSRDLITALGWAKEYRLPTVVFGPPNVLEEEHMLRLGASLCVNKPVDGERLITQARFLVG